MTEQEWLACEDPEPMLNVLQGKASDRKLLMFAVSAVKGTRELCDDRLLGLLAVTEQFADGMVSTSEVETHWGRNAWPIRPFAWARALGFRNTEKKRQFQRDQAPILVGLLRDIFPFHPITLSPSWLTSTVVSLANQMYESRDFSAMPILADALMDASCDNEEILTHCRGPGPHVRGCWVLDLLTNRE